MLVELRDRSVIADWCRRDPVVHAYELGDLDDFFWPFTRWFAWQPGEHPDQIALLYTEPDPPVLLAMAGSHDQGLTTLLEEIADSLPDRLYAHITVDGLEALARSFATEAQPAAHLRLGLASIDALSRFDTTSVELIGVDDLGELETLYAAAYPGTWFRPRMLETGRYVGLRDQGRLVCVAGVHVHAPTLGVAVLGNVATHPDVRGRGLATTACAGLCLMLLADGIDAIALNVHTDNQAAIGAYTRLGFVPATTFVEVPLRRR